jgi:hypothetical protein
MHSLAQHLQSQGRGNDSVLVHMTPREVGGLQSLAKAAGGSLTINPQTGLPEAGFLDSILPMVAGAVLTPLTGGIINPFTASLLVGGGTALATGNIGKGLMAGLGAYGGAGLGSALGLGANSFGLASTFGNQAVSQAGLEAAKTGAGLFDKVPFAEAAASGGAAVPGALSPSLTPGGLDFITNTAQTKGMEAARIAAGATDAAPAASGLGGLSTMQMVGLGGSLLGAMEPSGATAAPAEEDKYPYKGPYTPAPRQVQFPTNRDPNDSSEFRYFTPTNPVPNVVPYQQANATVQPQMGRPIGRGQVFGRFDPTIDLYAKGGNVDLEDGSFVVDARTVSELGNGSSSAGQELLARMGGRPIQGPGDGVSDSIRANIGGTQEARVARDEVKFSPNAVKRVGSGSAKKGAQRLYALMHQAQQARKKAKRGEDTGLAALVEK